MSGASYRICAMPKCDNRIAHATNYVCSLCIQYGESNVPPAIGKGLNVPANQRCRQAPCANLRNNTSQFCDQHDYLKAGRKCMINGCVLRRALPFIYCEPHSVVAEQVVQITKEMEASSNPSAPRWHTEWPKFEEALREKLQRGFEEYGDESFERPPGELLGELAEEALDLAGWGMMLWVRCRALADREHPDV